MLQTLEWQVNKLLQFSSFYNEDNLNYAKERIIKDIIRDAQLPMGEYFPFLKAKFFPDNKVSKRGIFTEIFMDNSEYISRLGTLGNENLESIKILTENQKKHFQSLENIGKYITYFQKSSLNETHFLATAIHQISLSTTFFNHIMQEQENRARVGILLNVISDHSEVLRTDFNHLLDHIIQLVSTPDTFCHSDAKGIYCSENAILKEVNPLSVTLFLRTRKKTIKYSYLISCLPLNDKIYLYNNALHLYEPTKNQLKTLNTNQIIRLDCFKEKNISARCSQYFSSDLDQLVPAYQHFKYFLLDTQVYVTCNETILVDIQGKNLTCDQNINFFSLSQLPGRVTTAQGKSYFIKKTNFIDIEEHHKNFHFLPENMSSQILDFDSEIEIEEETDVNFDILPLPDLPTLFGQSFLFRSLSISSVVAITVLLLVIIIVCIICIPGCRSCFVACCCSCCRKEDTSRLRQLYSPIIRQRHRQQTQQQRR